MPSDSILIVEDDPSLSRIAQAALDAEGYSIRTADTCKAGLALVKQQMPSLLILDLGLPDGTGWSLLEDIRRLDGGSEVRVIVMSSNRVTRSEIRSHNISKFISKPFDIGLLASAAHALLSSDSLKTGI